MYIRPGYYHSLVVFHKTSSIELIQGKCKQFKYCIIGNYGTVFSRTDLL